MFSHRPAADCPRQLYVTISTAWLSVPTCATLGAEGFQLQFREFTEPQGRSPRLDTFRALDNVDVAVWHARRTHDIDNCARVTDLRWARVYPPPIISFGR